MKYSLINNGVAVGISPSHIGVLVDRNIIESDGHGNFKFHSSLSEDDIFLYATLIDLGGHINRTRPTDLNGVDSLHP